MLLEFAANDDLPSFKLAVENGVDSLDFSAPWYSRSIGSTTSPTRRMCYADRTPAMIAALYGSSDVLSYILSRKSVNVNDRCVDDGATALHFAATGGSPASLDVVKILISANADVDVVDAAGNRPGDVIAKQFSASMAKDLEVLLKAPCPRVSSAVKKEYPPDLTLPDIKNGIYGTDEFRMYTFKVKPCSRAYSHDWTECPFVHPGENARRRDPRKYSYSCVPCPDFRKGSCLKGDSCEYAHGVFECWLHPAQYRTRLCKDETGCNRRVCFFAHKVEELRMVNPTAASVTGHGLSSPRSAAMGVSSLDMMAALLMPMSPSASPASTTWMNSSGGMMQPPALQLPISRLKSSFNARDLDFDLEMMGIEGYQQKLIDEFSTSVSSPHSNWKNNTFNSFSDYNDLIASIDPGKMSQLQSLSLKSNNGYGNSIPSSPTMPAAFAKRSQSFIDRGASPVSRHLSALSSPLASVDPSSPISKSGWGSPNGRLDWGIQGDELNKMRKSATFDHRSNGINNSGGMNLHHLMNDSPPMKVMSPVGRFSHEKLQQMRYQLNNGGGDFLSLEQLYAEQELMQMAA